MNVQELEIHGLIESPNNPNSMNQELFDALVQSMTKMGAGLQPILVRKGDKKGVFHIVDGHHRVRAANLLGIEKIPAVVTDLTEQQANVVQIGMNRIRGELDLGKVSDIIAELTAAGVSAEDLAITGFNEADLEALMRAAEDPDGEDFMTGAANTPEPVAKAPSPFLLEIEFSNKDDFARARRAIKRAAGKGQPLSHGLLSIIDAS